MNQGTDNLTIKSNVGLTANQHQVTVTYSLAHHRVTLNLARVDRLVYGATDPKAGAAASLYQVLADPRLNHRPVVSAGVLAEPCGAILSRFFRERRSG